MKSEEDEMTELFEKWEDKWDDDHRKYFTPKFKVNRYQLDAVRILTQVEKDTKIKCEDYINEYREHVFIDSEDNYKAKAKPGKQAEAEIAYKKLEKCTEFLYEIHSDLNENVEFAERFYYNQFNICRMACFKNKKHFNIPKIQVCLRKCRLYTFSYIDRATEDALQKWVIGKAVTVDTRSKENKFDYIIITEVIEHIQDPEMVLSCIKKNLPNAILYISIPNS